MDGPAHISATQAPTRLGPLHVQTAGAGPPAVLWHSLFVDSTTWIRVARPLAATRRLVLIDGPAHGDNPPVPYRFTLDDCACAAADVLDHFGIDQPVDWLGNAWGGHVGILFAAAHPGRCRTLTAIGAPVSRSPRPNGGRSCCFPRCTGSPARCTRWSIRSWTRCSGRRQGRRPRRRRARRRRIPPRQPARHVRGHPVAQPPAARPDTGAGHHQHADLAHHRRPRPDVDHHQRPRRRSPPPPRRTGHPPRRQPHWATPASPLRFAALVTGFWHDPAAQLAHHPDSLAPPAARPLAT